MPPRSIEHDHKSASPLCDRGRARYHAPRHTPRHLWNRANYNCLSEINVVRIISFFCLPNKSHIAIREGARAAAAPPRRAAPARGGRSARARRPAGGRAIGRARGAHKKKIRAYTIVRTCTCTYATYMLLWFDIAYEPRATPRRSRLFIWLMGSPGQRPAACANGVRTHIMQMQMAHIPGAGRRTRRPTYPFWASCGGPLPRRTVAAASCSRLRPGLSAQTRPKTRRPCSSSGQSAARSTCHPSWGRTW